jgi:hypothetical protein
MDALTIVVRAASSWRSKQRENIDHAYLEVCWHGTAEDWRANVWEHVGYLDSQHRGPAGRVPS